MENLLGLLNKLVTSIEDLKKRFEEEVKLQKSILSSDELKDFAQIAAEDIASDITKNFIQ